MPFGQERGSAARVLGYGIAILLFAEMIQRAIAKGYQWIDLSLTGEENPDTWDLAHHMGAQIYKRYRFYKKELS